MKILVTLFALILLVSPIGAQALQLEHASPFEHKFGDVKFLDAYFGTSDKKVEVSPGDKNVPFTVVFANIGTQDITGIKGQLLMPTGFSSIDGNKALIYAEIGRAHV